MNPDIAACNSALEPAGREVVEVLARAIEVNLPEAEGKVWHGHPVWFIEGNPVVGYNEAKDGMRLLFWSGQGFDEAGLSPVGKFKAAEARYASAGDVNLEDVTRWLAKARDIQWDYKNIARRKGVLERLK